MPQFNTQQDKRQFILKVTKFFIKDGKLYKCNGSKPPIQAILDLDTKAKI